MATKTKVQQRYAVACPDGKFRHNELFRTYEDAQKFAEWGHCCLIGHDIITVTGWRNDAIMGLDTTPFSHCPNCGGTGWLEFSTTPDPTCPACDGTGEAR